MKTRGQKVKNALADCSCTLVVAPVVAYDTLCLYIYVISLYQWQSEIKKYTKPNSLNVLIFHGPNRLDNAEEIKKYDVILTSYSTIETDYRFFIYCILLTILIRQETKGFKRKGEVIKKTSVLHSMYLFIHLFLIAKDIGIELFLMKLIQLKIEQALLQEVYLT